MYNESDLVSFGLYLLSKERTEKILGEVDQVHHADIENWKQSTAPCLSITE